MKFGKKAGREIKLGIFLTIALFLFVWGVNYLKGVDIFTGHIRFHVQFEDASGLLETNQVKVSGVKIGQVSRIAFHPDGSGRVIVTATIDRQIFVPDDSEIYLTGALIGEKELQITLGQSSRGIQRGDTVPGFVKPDILDVLTTQVVPFRDRAETIMIRTDSLLTAINTILNQESIRDIQYSIEGFQRTMASLEKTASIAETTLSRESDRFANIMANVESITTNIEDNNEVLNHIIQNINEISETLASDDFRSTILNTASTMETLSALVEKINAGEGSAGMLLQDDALYHNLNESSRQLELLLEDIRENPRRYFNISVFGR